MDVQNPEQEIELPYDYRMLPLRALRMTARKKLAGFLDLEGTVVLINEGAMDEADVVNDYNGLAELAGLTYNTIRNLQRNDSPTTKFLETWNDQNATVGNLWNFLIILERFDVLTDCRRSIMNDCRIYAEHLEVERSAADYDIQERLQDSTVTNSEMKVDETKYAATDDVLNQKKTYFDAFICYTDESPEDRAFVRTIIKKLEEERGLKLFVPGRNDLPGASQHTVTAYLIEERCRRVVILMSKQFLRSAVCDFQVRFAHALAPGARSRKLIPLIRERGTVIPRILRFLAVCDFTKQDMLDWVWDRLYAAIIAPIGKQTYFEPDDEENPFREESLKEITFPTFSPLDGPANSGNTDRKQSYLSEHSTPSMKAKSAASTPVMQPYALNNLDIGESYSVSPSFRQNNFNSAQTAIISKTDNTNAHNVTQNSYPSNSSNASAKNKKHKKVHPVSPLPRTSREPIEHPHHSGAKSDSHVISSTNPTASFGTRQRSNYRREVDETSYQSSRNNSQTISSTDGYFEIQL